MRGVWKGRMWCFGGRGEGYKLGCDMMERVFQEDCVCGCEEGRFQKVRLGIGSLLGQGLWFILGQR